MKKGQKNETESFLDPGKTWETGVEMLHWIWPEGRNGFAYVLIRNKFCGMGK